MRFVVAVALAACACRSANRGDGAPTEASPEPVASRPPAAPDAPAAEWTWTATKCLGGIDLPVPPQWRLNEITSGDGRCISSVGPPDRTGVNVGRGSNDLASMKAGIAKSWTIRSVVREETTPDGWLLVVDVGRPLFYAHGTDLQITCLGMHAEDIEIARRICAEARRR